MTNDPVIDIWHRLALIRAAREKCKGQLSLHIGCESCFHAFVRADGRVSCLPGWVELDASNCPDYDRTVHCLNGIVYPEKRGCNYGSYNGGGCEACWEEFERRMNEEVSYA